MAPELEGIILENGDVLAKKNKIYHLPKRGTDEEGYPEVLIDAESVGDPGFFQRQSVKPYNRYESNILLCGGRL